MFLVKFWVVGLDIITYAAMEVMSERDVPCLFSSTTSQRKHRRSHPWQISSRKAIVPCVKLCFTWVLLPWYFFSVNLVKCLQGKIKTYFMIQIESLQGEILDTTHSAKGFGFVMFYDCHQCYVFFPVFVCLFLEQINTERSLVWFCIQSHQIVWSV